MAVFAALDMRRRGDNCVNGHSHTAEPAANLRSDGAHVPGGLDDQQVDVAVENHLAPCSGPEEDDVSGWARSTARRTMSFSVSWSSGRLLTCSPFRKEQPELLGHHTGVSGTWVIGSRTRYM